MRNGELQPELSAKQQKAIAALLDSSTIKDAAEKAGVSRTTLDRWLDDEAFAGAYRAASHRVFETALSGLQAITAEAVQTLRDVQRDATARPGEKVAAAKAVLDFALKGREALEVEERLAYLEKTLEVQTARKENSR